jgi:hypothetical protein
MRGFLAVAAREIEQRRGVLLAAAVAALLPFLAPILPGVRGNDAAEVRLYTAAFLAFAFAAALSLVFGTTAIGGDLSQRRLGFYFSRPIGGAAIWSGKLAGAWLLIVVVTAIVIAPAGLFDSSVWASEARSGLLATLAAAFAAAVLVLLALGNVVSLALRSRSGWVAADLAALALWAGLLVTIGRSLLAAQAPVLLRNLAVAVGAACAAALLAAGGAQVSIGRVDAVRGNRARFATLWGLLFVIAALAFGGVRWLLSPSPGDLFSDTVASAAPTGAWIEIEGFARRRADLRAALFYDVSSGRYVTARVGSRGAAVISRDGSTAAWTEPTSFWADGPQDVWICKLAGGQRVHTPVSGRIWDLEVSPDGTRLAVTGESTTGVYEIPSGRLLGSIPLSSDERFTRIAFVERERLRVYRIPRLGSPASRDELVSIEAFDFDLGARKLVPRATIPNIRRPFALTFDDRERRLIVWERGSSLSLFDLDSGRLLAVLANAAWGATSRAFLSDGRIAIAETDGGAARLHLYSTKGEPEKVFELGPATVARVGAEPAPGKLAMGVGSGTPPWGPADGYLLDLRDGNLRLLGRHLDPVASRMRWRLPQPEPGSAASLLFSRNDGTLLLLDPATEKLTPVLGKWRRE